MCAFSVHFTVRTQQTKRNAQTTQNAKHTKDKNLAAKYSSGARTVVWCFAGVGSSEGHACRKVLSHRNCAFCTFYRRNKTQTHADTQTKKQTGKPKNHQITKHPKRKWHLSVSVCEKSVFLVNLRDLRIPSAGNLTFITDIAELSFIVFPHFRSFKNYTVFDIQLWGLGFRVWGLGFRV